MRQQSVVEAQICQQQGTAEVLLRQLHGAGIPAVLAGGAPRDWMAGRLATDLDVFVPEPDFVRACDLVGAKQRPFRTNYPHNHLTGLADFVVRAQHAQLVGTKMPVHSICRSFDYVINMTFWYVGPDGLLNKEDWGCARELANKTLTSNAVRMSTYFTTALDFVRNLLERTSKMRRKFPDHKLVLR